jgi:integrase
VATWVEGDITAFRERHNVGTARRLAFEVLLHTGLRRTDAVRLGWKHLTKDGFVITTKKSQGHVELCIPVHADLARYCVSAWGLSHDRRGVPSSEFNEIKGLKGSRRRRWGSVFDQHSHRTSWAKVCERAGVSGLTFHDLRGTAVVRLAIAGASVPQIAAVTGHSLKDVEAILDAHYLGRDIQLAEAAVLKLEARTKL